MSEDYQNRVVHSVQWRFDPITGEPLSAALVPLTQRPEAQTEREAFEEWWESDGPNTSSPYEAAMSAWEAGRASLPAPQQATPEPVGEPVGTVECYQIRGEDVVLGYLPRPLPVGTKLYTRPAPGVPEGWEQVGFTVSGDVTNWARDFSMYRTQHYTRTVFAAAQAKWEQE